jgi:hypothetical protein
VRLTVEPETREDARGLTPTAARMRAPAVATIRLLDRDPDLGSGLSPERFAAAREMLVARVVPVPAGNWAWGEMLPPPEGLLGVVVVGGIFARRVRVHSGMSVELLGPGDIIRPWTGSRDSAIGVEIDVSWHVLAPGTVALVDFELVQKSAEWPEVAAAVLDRAIGHARDLAFRHAAVGHPRVEDRLWLVLWQIAERFGRATRDGVIIALPGLTHDTLASLVAASRPSVTKALGELQARGLLARGLPGRLVLRGSARDGLVRRGPSAPLPLTHDTANA